MILDKALLIKGLVGTTTLVTIGTSAYLSRDHISKWFGTSKGNNTPGAQIDQQQPQEISETELIKKVGLNCNTPSEAGTECSKLTEEGAEKISVKQEESDEKFEIDTITVGKIKLYKLSGQDTGYHKGLKFVIEDGDITKESNKKLEQFETYEIDKDTTDNKYYLKRKFTKPQAIKKELGLPEDCNLTDNGCSEVTVDSGNIGQIKFDGASSSITPTLSTSAKLTVTKENTTDSYFPLGYKFNFKAESSNATLSIGSKNITIKANTGTEFRIKKDGKNLSLEEAWTIDNLAKEVNLNCGSDSICTQISNKTTNIKQDSAMDGKTIPASGSGSGSGKIKLYTGTDATGYNKDFKFVIEDGDITIDSSTSSPAKLEQFETYEIKKEGDKWYLSRKTKAIDEKKKLLGLPDDCALPTSDSDTKTCSEIDADKLKKINFEGKGTNNPTIDDSGKVKLKISKATTETDIFTEGYKFILESDKDITIPKEGSENISIKKNTNTEFKIKKTENKLTLEKAWTVTELAKKLGITTCDTNAKTCDLTSSINIWFESNDKIDNASISETNKKLKYEEDQENHNQGFKFYVDEDISLSGGSNDKKINKKEENNGPTYEIKQQTVDNTTKWYLSKVTPTAGS